jgi:hypothetical protein
MKKIIEQVNNEALEVQDLISALLSLCEKVNVEQFKKIASESDLILKRVLLAKYLLSLNDVIELKSVKSTDTLRELLYNCIAVETKKSIAFHKEAEAKASDTLKDIKSSEKCKLVFSSLYKKEFDKRIK